MWYKYLPNKNGKIKCQINKSVDKENKMQGYCRVSGGCVTRKTGLGL
jgi:hypothetical protein